MKTNFIAKKKIVFFYLYLFIFRVSMNLISTAIVRHEVDEPVGGKELCGPHVVGDDDHHHHHHDHHDTCGPHVVSHPLQPLGELGN